MRGHTYTAVELLCQDGQTQTAKVLDVSQPDSGGQQAEPNDVQRQMSQEEISGRSAGRRTRIAEEDEPAEWECQGHQVTSAVLSRQQPRVSHVQ